MKRLKETFLTIWAALMIVAAAASARLTAWRNDMIGAMEKGIAAARLSRPPEGSYAGVDLSVIPQYVSFRAALLKEKLTLQWLLLSLAILFATYVVMTRVESASLREALRQKEYILAPGVTDFTTASPQTVPDRYVEQAVNDFVSKLGSINATNIDEQYAALTSFMNVTLRVRFEAESEAWKARVKEERLTEAMAIIDRSIATDDQGRYRAVVRTRTDSFIRNTYAGARDEVIEMEMALVPPKDGRRWFLEITGLTRAAAETYRGREASQKGASHD